ncbi:unnamed protein product [Penicillium olsonii]|uniref:Zn(2)-C6 fungal-type domain-containing protein n=1 Tax=Penicillium olsonii TaxID=99116 RepID=A0A9W4HG12_PENOL|nr:unnamed protein product [Penicillium olsonii]CAG8039651.1 unnamed protein product [Penicillium olsonii]
MKLDSPALSGYIIAASDAWHGTPNFPLVFGLGHLLRPASLPGICPCTHRPRHSVLGPAQGANEHMTKRGTPKPDARNSEISTAQTSWARSNMNDQTLRQSPATPAPSRTPEISSSRKKACRRCTKSKVRCDLAKPNCNRCIARGSICEYPISRVARQNVHRGSNGSLSSPSPRSQNLTEDTLPASTPAARPQHPSESHSSCQADRPLQTSLDLSRVTDIELVPMIAAGEIRDRWLRPYISASTGQEPKELNLHTIQYLTCVLKSYLRNLCTSVGPPFVHQLQFTQSPSPVLSYCCANIRTWIGKCPEYEIFIMKTIHDEMKKIETQETFQNDYEILCSFQAYLLYSMALHFYPLTNATEDALPPDCQFQTKMQELAFRSARAGLLSKAEESSTRPGWESWILTSCKRRTLITMYIFTNVYNSQMSLPNFVAEELRGVIAPESKVLWEAGDRIHWEKEYNDYLSKWPDGKLQISELWKSEETGTPARRERIERWLQSADEFGMMVFATCAHIHGC